VSRYTSRPMERIGIRRYLTPSRKMSGRGRMFGCSCVGLALVGRNGERRTHWLYGIPLSVRYQTILFAKGDPR